MRPDVVKIPFKLNYAAPLETEKRFSILQNCIYLFFYLCSYFMSVMFAATAQCFSDSGL